MTFGFVPGVQFVSGDVTGGPPLPAAPTTIPTTLTKSFPYQGGSPYTAGSLVVYNNVLYINIVPITGITDLWDDTFAGPTRFSLSPDGLTATTLIDDILGTIRDTNPHTLGKFYVEFQVGAASQDLAYGIGTAAVTSATFPSAPGLPAICYHPSTNQWLNLGGGVATGMAQPATGAVVGLAIDLTAGHLWVCNATTAPTVFYGHNGVGDPVAGTNPQTFTPFGAATYALFCSNENLAGQACKVNFGGINAFTGFAPTGYLGWGSNLVPPLDPTHWAQVGPIPPEITIPTTSATANNNIYLGAATDAPSSGYNLVSLNNGSAGDTIQGLQGGSTADPSLYILNGGGGAEGIVIVSGGADVSPIQSGGTTLGSSSPFGQIYTGAGVSAAGNFVGSEGIFSGGVAITAGALVVSGGTLMSSTSALTQGSGSSVGTLTNSPVSGNPTKWIAINDGGTVRHIPAW
jgi:hypothetical protein